MRDLRIDSQIYRKQDSMRIFDTHLFGQYNNDLFMELYIFIHHIEGHTISLVSDEIEIPQINGMVYHIAGHQTLKIENEGYWYGKECRNI